MKTLYLDCSMGAAGDMISAALLELTPDPDAAVAKLNALGLPGVEFRRERTSRCGIAASRLVVTVNGEEEPHGEHGPGHEHHHEHRHAHHHEHHHRSLEDMLRIVDSLAIPEKTKSDVAAVYRLLAGAESRAHGRPVGEVHVHDGGAMDAVAEISAACWLAAALASDKVVASPVNVGGGTVHCAHGTMPVPAPATALLLEGIPAHGDEEAACELCTPTGAAILKHLVGRFGPMPTMRADKVGFGAGGREIEGRANILRATLGESAADAAADEVCELRCNIDDMTGEEIAFACERIFAAGALDVLTVPATMKKGRPGVVLEVLCANERHDEVVAAIFRHTSTIGVREHICRRMTMTRRTETAAMPDGSTVRVKVSEGFGVTRRKPEHDDVAAYALSRGISLSDARPTA
ncbi:MAG: nickel pincer cofactor biosynthesis protein LarC [Kiritimatiellae bacterium]|nr:nickel pincer cofactor biosynthesis protein LarC [Kiritimatiellia bacterium]